MFCVLTGNIFGYFSSFYVFFHCNGIPLKLTETTMLTFTVTLSRKLSIIRGDVNISHRQPQKVPEKVTVLFFFLFFFLFIIIQGFTIQYVLPAVIQLM